MRFIAVRVSKAVSPAHERASECMLLWYLHGFLALSLWLRTVLGVMAAFAIDGGCGFGFVATASRRERLVDLEEEWVLSLL
jgi:hypothetical protein